MEIRNDTPFAHALALGMGPDRRPHLGVLLKATFTLPEAPDAAPQPAPEQLPVAASDEFYDGDVVGSVRIAGEGAVFKPRADVALVGSAHAPGGRPATAVDVALRVGRHMWALRVTGNRRWLFPSRAVMVPLVSDPEPFTRMALRYERAFGGFDHRARSWCAENPIGRGYIGRKSRESVHESLLPNVEDPRSLIRSWDDQPTPAGFGFVRQDWAPRARFAGVRHDDLDPEFGLPADFDHAFFNAAHPALQVPFLQGNEVVELQHLTPDGRRRFSLPGLAPRATLAHYADAAPEAAGLDGDEDLPERPTRDEPLPLRLDTLVLMPDDGILYLIWRGNTPVRDLALADLAAVRLALDAPPSR